MTSFEASPSKSFSIRRSSVRVFTLWVRSERSIESLSAWLMKKGISNIHKIVRDYVIMPRTGIASRGMHAARELVQGWNRSVWWGLFGSEESIPTSDCNSKSQFPMF